MAHRIPFDLPYPGRGSLGVVRTARVPPGERASRPSLGALLRVPLFQKLLLASAAVVFAVALAALLVAPLLASEGEPPALGVLAATALGAALLTMPLQALVLRVALRPLAELTQVAERIEAGESGARVPSSPLADPQIERLGALLNRALDRMAEDRERLQAVAERAFHAQEAERARIARELQEEIAQSLATMLLQLRAARQAPDTAVAEERLDVLRTHLVDTTDAVRRYARGLHPPALRELGVVTALEGLARSLGESSGLDVEVQQEGVRGALPPRGELALYRIVQEALSNAARHAGAVHARVELALRDGHVEATVEDDGHGFDLEEVQREGACLGLYGMRERALYLGGTAVIESQTGEGTRVRVRIPTSAMG